MYVRVALNIPTDKTFHYLIPPALESEAACGKRVIAPFGKRVLTGYILEKTSLADVENVKEIIEIPDHEPLFSEDDLRFYRWISRYYLYPLGKTLFDILPAGGGSLKMDTWIFPVASDEEKKRDLKGLSDACRNLMEVLKNFPDGISSGRLRGLQGIKNIGKEIEAMESQGLIVTDCRYKSQVRPKKETIVSLVPAYLNGKDQQGVKLTEKQKQVMDFIRQQGNVFVSILRMHFSNASYLVACLRKKGVVHCEAKEVYRLPGKPAALFVKENPVLLNKDQEKALFEISQGLSSRTFSPYLLHGVTGSGKTEVYLKAMEKVREQGGGVIFLVPEIGLTPQLLSRIGDRFGDQEIAVLHSGISNNVRYDRWRHIQSGEVKMAVGARSALFVPMRNLRLIIVDEEHDGSYKQDERLRYNARDMAIVKAKMNEATVVLGSATPAVQTYFNALNKKYSYLGLPQRIECRTLPSVEVVDMRAVRDKTSQTPILSQAMIDAVGETLAAKNQVLLFLNRRGFNTVVLCTDCGHVFKCLNCDLVLTYHAAFGVMKCHFCDFALKAFPRCPSCRGNRITSYGVGTEKLEEEIKSFFPEARVGRMDSDTTARRGEQERILASLAKKEIDILVGTQMITKGHDFPSITLVGVISADLSLNVPDFRAGERTFQILTQVAGRGGRGHVSGRVVVQTFNPDHYAVKRAQTHDYQGFYEDEIELRKALSYPPYTRLVNMHVASLKEDRGRLGIDNMAKLVKDISGTYRNVEVLGPAKSPVAKIKGKYRWQILLKGKDMKSQTAVVETLRVEALKMGLEVRVDVDPLNFM